ncbi:hypothetical protein BC827DRAFT_944961 [Russula dissimulans]|nr:hypothetical protein BC827DRAFT_944961 [Russula dissimulans]
MSALERKDRTSDSQKFDTIQDLVLRIKTKLNHRADSQSAHAPLVAELYELSTLSERLRSNSSESLLDQRQADILDREGTYLWNHSSYMRLWAGDQISAVVAACLVHMLQLASMTGATLAGNVYLFLARNKSQPYITACDSSFHSFFFGFRIVLFSDLGKFELATSVLTSAAKVRRPCKCSGVVACSPFCVLWLFQFEQSLRNADDHQNLHQQSISQATVVYYCSRMEAAWKEGNDSVAQYMLRNITGMLL